MLLCLAHFAEPTTENISEQSCVRSMYFVSMFEGVTVCSQQGIHS